MLSSDLERDQLAAERLRVGVGVATPIASRASASLTGGGGAGGRARRPAPPGPGGKRSAISCWPCTDSGGSRYCSVSVEVAAAAEVAERAGVRIGDREPDQQPRDGGARARRSALHPRALPGGRSGSTRGIAGQNARRPSTAEHRGQQRQPGGHHHDDAEREDRTHLARRVEVGEPEHEHRRDHDPAGGEDRRRRPLASRARSPSSTSPVRAARRGSATRSAARSPCRRRTSARSGSPSTGR